jgi:hypothetical protein
MKTHAKALILAATLVSLAVLAACAGASAPAKTDTTGGLGLPSAPGGAQRGLLSYAVPCYIAQGGANIVAADGCTITVQDGGALALESGASVTGVITNDLDGAQLILDPGGNTKIQATANYQPILTLGGTPTAAALTIQDVSGTPPAVIRGGAGGVDITGLLSANGGLALVGHLKAATAVPAAVVTGTALAPGALLQPVSMATAGTVPITVPAAGRIVCLWNTGSQAVTFADNSTQQLAGSFAMGQYDVICGISDGTRFIEITRSNN